MEIEAKNPDLDAQNPPAQKPDLIRGMSGPDVAALQNLLFQNGYRIAEHEQSDKFFGDSTYDSLVDYQKKQRLVPNGIFDSKAAWVLDDEKEHPKKFIVLGQVLKANGTPMNNVTVKVFDKDLRTEQLMKTDITKQAGEYLVFYHADDFAANEKDRADVFVQVVDASGTVLATSKTIFNASKVEWVNFTIGESRGLSEFEKIVNEITPLLRNIPQADLNGADVSFLSGETRIDAALITLVAESARRKVQANAIPQATFYGLFRQGFAIDLVTLLGNEISLLRSALEQSSNCGIIPQLSTAELDQIAEQLRLLKITLILQPAGSGETASLGDLLATSQLAQEKRSLVADLLVQHGGATQAFWDAISASSLTPPEKNDARFTLRAGDLTTNFLPLVNKLRNAVTGGVPTTPINDDAAQLRTFAVKDVADWKAMLAQVGAPSTTPGATPQEKIDSYAKSLNAYMENALPTPVIAGRADKDVAGDNPFSAVKSDLKTFFNNNKSYEFRETPIDVFVNNGVNFTGVANPAALVAELKNMQRLFNVTPRYAEMRSLRKDGLHSALSMVKVGERRFVERYASVLGGEAVALETYRKAKQTHATALNFYLSQAAAPNSASPAVVPTGMVKKSIAKFAAQASAGPDLPALFGSLELCDCEQCQSVYSPAAYFVDILKFLGDGPKKGTQTPLDVLFTRRPDLQHIELTCENTTTQLPYVDLTSEIMEAAVASRTFKIAEGADITTVLADLNLEKTPQTFRAIFVSKGYVLTDKASVRVDDDEASAWLILDSGWVFTVKYLGSQQGFDVVAWPQTSWTGAELRANPEHVHNAAHDELLNAVYSWDLPFNLAAEEIRGYLAHFGVKRTEVMETFFRGPQDVLMETSIANEYIGVTEEESRIITGVKTGGSGTPSGPWDFWGLLQTGNNISDPTDGSAPPATGDWDVVLKRVSIFLQKSGLGYREMLELLGSYFINPATSSGRTLGVVSTDTQNPATCNLSRLEIQVVDSQISDKKAALTQAWKKIHRFVRLARKLGWTMRDLDKAIVALQPMNGSAQLDITARFIVQLSHIKRLSDRFGLPVVSLLSFWATMDAGRYLDHFAEGEPAVPSLYATLFNNRAAAGQALPEDPSTLTGKLSENKSTIAAALQVSIDDLALLLADSNVVSDDNLNLANLSKLYRHTTFAKALNYPIRIYLAALKLINTTPFAATEDTIKFVEQSERIAASGFSVEDLNYLFRHDFSSTYRVAISDPTIAVVLDSIRTAIRKVTTDDSFVDAESVVIKQLGEFLQLDSSTARELLTNWIRSTADSSKKAISVFLDPSFTDSDPDTELTRLAFPHQFNTFVRLYKIATLSLKFGLSAQQVRWLFEFGPDNGWIDLNKLPYNSVAPAQPLFPSWARVADLFKLSAALPLAEPVLTDVFTSANNGAQIDELLTKISAGFSWKSDNLIALNSGFGFQAADYKDEKALCRLHEAFKSLNHLGASADQCLSWTKATMTPPDERKFADDVKALVRAQLGADQWLEKARSLNDPLREKLRAALVSYLMPRKGARTADELYDDFLVDVEMSPCMMTTRIKQAIGSIQLFIQRSLMNLESQVALTPREAREWAEWRKQYRVWEANRKILLYPENWIEPELRDGKSPFFEELEDELQQSEVTMDTAETALAHYLEKLHEVARLEIVGMYRQQEFADDGSIVLDQIHVIGRNFSAPHIYYYRRQIDSVSWTAWEKVEADIQGNHLIPVIWNRRLYLFWPIFSVKQQEQPIKMPAAGATMERGEKVLEVQFAWTEYKNGKWSAKRISSPFRSPITHPESELSDSDFKLFSFKSRIESTSDDVEQLFIDFYGPIEKLNTVTVTSNDPRNKQQTFLFSLAAGKTKSVSASVNKGAFQAADASRVEILAKDANNVTISTLTLSNTGTIDIKNSTANTLKYFLSSADYLPVDIVVTGQKQICWIEDRNQQPLLIGKNGDSAERALAGVETKTIVASIGVEAFTPLAGSMVRPGETQVCEIISEATCEFDLVTIPITSTSTTFTTKSVEPTQAIATFYFDDGQQTVSALLGSNAISKIEPVMGTRFENMMMVEYANQSSDGLGDTSILQATPTKFRLLPMHQSYAAKKLEYPAFFQDDTHTYFVNQDADSNLIQFSTFYHPTLSKFFRSLNHSGVSGLLTLANQRLIDTPVAFDNYSADPDQVDTDAAPREDVDFRYEGAYSIYNWELFFHTPFTIATQLSTNQRFEEAQKWFHYIFDPTATDSPESAASPGTERFWRVLPFYKQALHGSQTLEDLFADAKALKAQISEWQANPFKPHVIARLRLVTYMKAVVMRYIDNLIAWGDQLFRRDTIESINEATQLYILAAQILGRRPEQIPARARAKIQTFRTLDDEAGLNGLANASVEIEGFLSPSVVPPSETDTINGMPLMPFFGIPGNEKLLGYWTTVADRLFKIRHCLNIEGVVRSLPAFDSPIDPALLVRAAGAGVDITSALSDINVALPNYRFNTMLQKANELCSEVKSLGNALLVTLEKRDAEELALLRSTHEVKVLRAVRAIKEKQVEDAQTTRDGLDRSKELITIRRDYYRDIAFMNDYEDLSLALTTASLVLQGTQAFAHALSGTFNLIPDGKTGAPPTWGLTWGGSNLGQAMSEYGASLGVLASGFGTGASMAAIMGGHYRRFDDWKLQERLANKELEQIEKQIAAADIRKAIAETELRTHDLQVENTREVDEVMRGKFTNRELYDWMVGQISGIYFQSYQLAYDVAKRAESAYRYELAVKDSSFIQFGYWDSLKKGLLAGERLGFDLKRMEVAYLDQNKREYEIVKHVSLLSIDPVALLKLKQTGECFVTLPETLFDVDYAGHYMRRMKSVGLTIPCVTGPYTGINCTLTLQNSHIRHINTLLGGKYARQSDDSRFTDTAGPLQSIVTSSGQNDSGLFEANLRDERYLPFEGQGAISTWRIQLPKTFKSFDYNTISDVVMHVRYTSREGGNEFKDQAERELQTMLNDFVRFEGQRGLKQMFSLRHDFPTEWSRFLNVTSGVTRSLTMPLIQERFPLLFQGRSIAFNEIELFVKVKPGVAEHDETTIKLTLAPGATAPGPDNAQPGDVLALTPWNGMVRGPKTVSATPGAFTLNAWRRRNNENLEVDASAIHDILVVCRYTC